jgi:hypothetical protein
MGKTKMTNLQEVKKDFRKKFVKTVGTSNYYVVADPEKCWFFIESSIEQAVEAEDERCFGLFDEILNEALGDKEMADDPKDPKIRIIWLKDELKGYLKRLLKGTQKHLAHTGKGKK